MSDHPSLPGFYLRLFPSSAMERAGYSITTLDEPLWGIGPLGQVNLFVGSTSSGKSRLMRSILKQTEYDYCADERHIRASGIALAKLERLLGTHQKPGLLWNMEIKLAGRLQHTFNPDIDSLFTHESPRSGYNDSLRFNARFWNELREFADTGKASQYHPKVLSMTNLMKYICQTAKDALEIGSHQKETDGFSQRLVALNELMGLLVALEGDLCKHAQSTIAPLSRMKPKRIYIPVLRNPNPLNHTEHVDHLLSQTVRANYSLPNDVEIATGQELYRDMHDTRNAVGMIRDQHTEFERFLASTFFGNARVEIVPINEDRAMKLRRITIRIGDVERDLPAVGDGIQSLAILMYALFRADDGTHIFIEEPENSLHPGLQRIMIQAMLTNPFLRQKNLRIFMTTHSNHLVDLSIRNFREASIFVFEKYPAQANQPLDERFLVRPANNQRMHAIASLEALNSSVLMANCSIWVEGVTDRRYIRAYLDAYWGSSEFKEDRKAEKQSESIFMEDIHYTFFEYGGSNLAHFVYNKDAEAGQQDVDDDGIKMQFVANRVFLVADQDSGKDSKHERWRQRTADTNDFYYYVTLGREVENMVSAPLLKALLANDFISDLNVTPAKIETVRESDYLNMGIGKYLNSHLDVKVTGEYGETLNKYYKDKLSKAVAAHLRAQSHSDNADYGWDLLSDEAKALAKKIDKFIRMHNPRVMV